MSDHMKLVTYEEIANRVALVSNTLNVAKIPFDEATLLATGILFFNHLIRHVPDSAHEKVLADIKEMAKSAVRLPDDVN